MRKPGGQRRGERVYYRGELQDRDSGWETRGVDSRGMERASCGVKVAEHALHRATEATVVSC